MSKTIQEALDRAGVPSGQRPILLKSDVLFLPEKVGDGVALFRSDSLDVFKSLRKEGRSAELVKPVNAKPRYVVERAGDVAKLGELIVANWREVVAVSTVLAGILLRLFSAKKIEFRFGLRKPDGTLVVMDVKGDSKQVADLVTKTAKEWSQAETKES